MDDVPPKTFIIIRLEIEGTVGIVIPGCDRQGNVILPTGKIESCFFFVTDYVDSFLTLVGVVRCDVLGMILYQI